MMKKILFIISIIFLIGITSGTIIVNSSNITQNSIMWNFDKSVNNMSVDGVFNLNYDNRTGFFIYSNLKPNTSHQINVYSDDDTGANISKTLSEEITITNEENFYAYIMAYILFLAGLLCCIFGLKIPFVGFGGVLFGLAGITTQLHESFVNGILYLCIICAGFFIGFKGGEN